MRTLFLAGMTFCILSAAAFASGRIEATGGYPVQSSFGEEKVTTGGYNVTANTERFLAGPSAGINYINMNEATAVGFGLFLNMQFPLNAESEIKSNRGNVSERISAKDAYDSYHSFDALLGAVFNVVSGSVIEIPVTFGGHLRFDRYQTKGASSSRSDVYLGLGGSAAVNLFFARPVYLTVKCQIAYDFLVLSKNETVKSAVSVVPAIGLGFKL
ncbi:hypothetical protein [Treponema brennaborense]|uniref:Outer membrane protein beta-barrel domain-containing protein n=1 Tax=Treponema brennaborense (strain DSM 12168 / CIP 105900 / DD5/3) TaxID=906968 RepID=F4LMT4_TREBD|nr:hypothetical protein [Treponema brennaborense]AEE17824.1 hypothetical protein Trebr_2417 [Treponema brennaborense DSM 12168]